MCDFKVISLEKAVENQEPMFQTGLLVVTASLNIIHSKFKIILSTASRIVRKTLYIHFQPASHKLPLSSEPSLLYPINKHLVSNVISSIYCSTFSSRQALDVRILLGHLKSSPTPNYKWREKCEVMLTDYKLCLDSSFSNFVQDKFCIHNEAKMFYFIDDYNQVTEKPSMQQLQIADDITFSDIASEEDLKCYDNIVLGGTFDRLHNAHKILFSVSALKCNKNLTIGVTDGDMLKGKHLFEMIEPAVLRMENVRNFLQEVDPTLNYNIVPILDPFGPSIVDPDLQCIVVSEETIRGGQKVNEERLKKGFTELDIHCINLYADECRAPEEEEKISSSSLRKRLLGTLLRPPQDISPKIPYIIGLTGGIASGKSNIAERLESLGAAIIDCDKLGHHTYIKGTKTYHDIVAYFGEDVLNDLKDINRKALGKKVFVDKKSLEVLNKFTWPEVKLLTQQAIKTLAHQGKTIIVMDAAVLIEAGWYDIVHEIWVTFIPKQEAILRVVNRDNLSEENARQRVESQISNEERLGIANVVFCSLWSPEVTKKQVEKAWQELQERIKTYSVKQAHL